MNFIRKISEGAYAEIDLYEREGQRLAVKRYRPEIRKNYDTYQTVKNGVALRLKHSGIPDNIMIYPVFTDLEEGITVYNFVEGQTLASFNRERKYLC